MVSAMRLCNRCRAAENPLGKLQFVKSPEGLLCANCYTKLYARHKPMTSSPAASTTELVVVVCPECRGTSPGPNGVRCGACVGYGVVRLAKNAIPVYEMKTAEEVDD